LKLIKLNENEHYRFSPIYFCFLTVLVIGVLVGMNAGPDGINYDKFRLDLVESLDDRFLETPSLNILSIAIVQFIYGINYLALSVALIGMFIGGLFWFLGPISFLFTLVYFGFICYSLLKAIGYKICIKPKPL